MLRVVTPGLQSTLQGAPRIGTRHFGIPAAGPADPLSMALANRLVENEPSATALEITFGGFAAEFEGDCAVAITGAAGQVLVSGGEVPVHETMVLKAGDTLTITPPTKGVRAYLAIRSGFVADTAFGSTSTYLPAGFGGLAGRTVQAGDVLRPSGDPDMTGVLTTPPTLRPVFTGGVVLRACPSAEFDLLDQASKDALFSEHFSADRQPTRMGVALKGSPLTLSDTGRMKSAPVFPGTVQCPPAGSPILLMCDAQTTGGYPRIASIARCDRHLLGQIRPGDSVHFLRRSPDAAINDDEQKRALLSTWIDL